MHTSRTRPPRSGHRPGGGLQVAAARPLRTPRRQDGAPGRGALGLQVPRPALGVAPGGAGRRRRQPGGAVERVHDRQRAQPRPLAAVARAAQRRGGQRVLGAGTGGAAALLHVRLRLLLAAQARQLFVLPRRARRHLGLLAAAQQLADGALCRAALLQLPARHPHERRGRRRPGGRAWCGWVGGWVSTDDTPSNQGPPTQDTPPPKTPTAPRPAPFLTPTPFPPPPPPCRAWCSSSRWAP